MSKICPLLSMGHEDTIECVEEECEWYLPPVGLKSDGSCAVRAAAEGIPSLGKSLSDKLDKMGTKI